MEEERIVSLACATWTMALNDSKTARQKVKVAAAAQKGIAGLPARRDHSATPELNVPLPAFSQKHKEKK